MNSEHTETASKTRRLAGILTAGLALAVVAANVRAEQAKDSTAARLQAIEDRLAIEQLVYGDYSKAVDAQNWKAFAERFFTDDAEVRIEQDQFAPKVYKGHAEIERVFGGSPANAPPPPPAGDGAPPQIVSGKHVISNLSVEIHGDQATARAYWTQFATTKDGKTLVGKSGRYDDTFKRENGRWKLYRKVITDMPENGAWLTPPPQR